MELLRSQIPAALFAFLMWGGWAFWVNRGAEPLAGVISGLTQGSSSLIFTLIMAAAVGQLSSRFRQSPWRVLLPPLVTVSFTTSFLLLAHWLAGTPHILFTIAAPTAVGFCYCLYLSIRLARQAPATGR